MLNSAVLGTLADIDPKVVGIDPHVIHAIRNQIGLSGKTRNPKTMVRVRGEQFQECWSGVRWVADRNVQFVCGDDSKSGVSQLPPELMPNDGHIHSSSGLGCVLDDMDNA